jgi:hypothetical protein
LDRRLRQAIQEILATQDRQDGLAIQGTLDRQDSQDPQDPRVYSIPVILETLDRVGSLDLPDLLDKRVLTLILEMILVTLDPLGSLDEQESKVLRMSKDLLDRQDRQDLLEYHQQDHEDP